MKPTQHLITAMALTLSAWPLCAQERQPDRPPTPPPRDGGPARGDQQVQRPMASLFGALDANHDGAIDAQELKQAADVIGRLDRNGDGRVTPDEMRPPGDSRRAQADGRGSRDGGPQGDVRERRGDDRKTEPRREDIRRDGERPRGPAADNRGADNPRDGGPARGPGAERPRDQRGPGDGPRREGPLPPRDGEARRGDAQGVRPDERGQAQHGPRGGGDRFAKRGDGRPDFGRGNPWAWNRENRAPMGPMTMGPRMGDDKLPALRRDDFGPREFRNDMGARRPQEGEMRPPMPQGPGRDRQDFRPEDRPNFGPREGDRGPGEMRRPEDRGDRGRNFGPQRPRGDRDFAPDGPPPRRDVQ